MTEEDPSLQGSGSPTIKMFKGSITFAILLASPLILMGIVSIVGSAFHLTGATLGLMGVLTMVIGFCGILIYYYQTASALLGKTTLNKLHWETPSNDIGYSAVIEEQVYLGKIKGTNLHHIFYKFEGDIPNELMICPAHPNDIVGQPRRDWIPYKNLIYPASVASVDTVELRKSDLGLDEDSGYVVSYPIASSWHATQVQQDAGRLLTGEKLLANPHPTEDIVNKAIKSLEASETVLTKEKLIQSERQKEAYKQIVKAGKTRLADTYADIAELETEAKKKPPAVMGEGWTQGSRLRKVAIVGVVGLASIIAGVITYFVIVG